MFETLAQGASHPAVAAWLGLGTAAVAAVVVAMAWSVNARQIRLAELLARRQFPIISGNGAAKEGAPGIEGTAIEGAAAKEGAPRAKPAGAGGRAGPEAAGAGGRAGPGAGGRGGKVPPEVIEGPDEVVAGEQARFRVQSAGPHQVVSWAVGGGAVSHAPDPGSSRRPAADRRPAGRSDHHRPGARGPDRAARDQDGHRRARGGGAQAAVHAAAVPARVGAGRWSRC